MRLLLLAAVLTAPAFAAEPTNAELAARIAGLEARMAQLEAHRPSAPDYTLSGQAADKANWAKCKGGMTTDQVLSLLGKPNREETVSAVNQYPAGRNWSYGEPGINGGTVAFQGDRVMQCFTWGAP